MALNDNLIDKILEEVGSGDLLGEDGILKQLTKRLVDRMLDGELTDHLGYKKHDPAGNNTFLAPYIIWRLLARNRV